MAEKKNVSISHVHEDDKILPKLKDLLGRAGMDVRDGSISNEKPNNATSVKITSSKRFSRPESGGQALWSCSLRGVWRKANG
jgi:hypothetical protein